MASEITMTLDDVLSSMRTLTVELISSADINDLISIRPVEGVAGGMQVMLAPKHPESRAILVAAHDYMAKVDPALKALAREHAGDVFEFGTIEFSMLLALLNTVQP